MPPVRPDRSGVFHLLALRARTEQPTHNPKFIRNRSCVAHGINRGTFRPGLVVWWKRAPIELSHAI
jgi:hypothetical protein